MHILHDFIHHFRVEHVEGSFILSKILLLCPTSPSATEVTILTSGLAAACADFYSMTTLTPIKIQNLLRNSLTVNSCKKIVLKFIMTL